MEATSAYRQSQIGGHTPTKKKKHVERKNSKKHKRCDDWRLSAHEKDICSNLFGDDYPYEEYAISKYIKSWKASIVIGLVHGHMKCQRAGGSGNSCSILKELENKCFQDCASSSLKETRSRRQITVTHDNILTSDSEHMSDTLRDDFGVHFMPEDDVGSVSVESNDDRIGYEDCTDKIDPGSINNDCDLDIIFGQSKRKEDKHASQIANIIFDGNDRIALVAPPPQLDLTSRMYTVWNSVSSESEETFSEHSDRHEVASVCTSEISIKQADADDLCDFFKPIPNCEDKGFNHYEQERCPFPIKESSTVEGLETSNYGESIDINCGQNNLGLLISSRDDKVESTMSPAIEIVLDSLSPKNLIDRDTATFLHKKILLSNDPSPPHVEVCDDEVESIINPMEETDATGSHKETLQSNGKKKHVEVYDEEVENVSPTTENIMDSGCTKNPMEKKENFSHKESLQSNDPAPHVEVREEVSPATKIVTDSGRAKKSMDHDAKEKEAIFLQKKHLLSNGENIHDEVETLSSIACGEEVNVECPPKKSSTEINGRNKEGSESLKDVIVPFHSIERDEVQQSVVIFGGLQLPSQLEDSSISTVCEDDQSLQSIAATDAMCKEACNGPVKIKNQNLTQSVSGVTPAVSIQEENFATSDLALISNLEPGTLKEPTLRSSNNSTTNTNCDDQKCNVELHDGSVGKDSILESSGFCLPSQDSSSDSDSNSSLSIHLGSISLSLVKNSVNNPVNLVKDASIPKQHIENMHQKATSVENLQSNSGSSKSEITIAQSYNVLNHVASRVTSKLSLRRKIKTSVNNPVNVVKDASIPKQHIKNMHQKATSVEDLKSNSGSSKSEIKIAQSYNVLNHVASRVTSKLSLKRKKRKIDVSKGVSIKLGQGSDSKESACNIADVTILRETLMKSLNERTNTRTDSSQKCESDTSSSISYQFSDNLTPVVIKPKKGKPGKVLLSQPLTPQASLLLLKRSPQLLPSHDLTNTPIIHANKGERHNLSLDALTDTPDLDNGVKLLNPDNKLKKKINVRRGRLRSGAAMLRLSSKQKSTSRNSRCHVRQNNPSLCNFFDLEAEVDGEESDENENTQISHDSFINDSSQLGHTQDELDLAEDHNSSEPCDQGIRPRHDSAFYRSIDNQQTLADSFSTPVLNRKHHRESFTSQNHSEIETQLSVASSDKALGNMHFIRSVIEHHRKGGDADEIETEYLSLRRENTKEPPPNNNHIVKHSVTSPNICERTTSSIHFSPTLPGSHVLLSTHSDKEPTLTSKQKARIEMNRQKAMKIRTAKMKLKKTNEG